MRRLALLAVGAALVAGVVALMALWVVPSARGPYVDCGPLDQATCDRAVADIIATHRHGWEEGLEDQLPPDLPVLSVSIGPAGVADGGCVWEYTIIWPGGGWTVNSSCATLAEICARLDDIERDLSSPPGLPSPRPDCDD